MLKNISNLGLALNKSEQKSIKGGYEYCDCAPVNTPPNEPPYDYPPYNNPPPKCICINL